MALRLSRDGPLTRPVRRRRKRNSAGFRREPRGQMLPAAKAQGLLFVELTTDPENIASQRAVEANGGVLHERFVKPVQYGSAPGLRYRVVLP